MTHPSPELDVEAIRADTPACRQRLFFNNAGASLMPRPVARAMLDYQQCELELGPHLAADEHAERLAGVSAGAAQMLEAEGGIEFFDSVSRAHALCLQAMEIEAGDRLLMAEDEWGGIIPQVDDLARRVGARVERIPCPGGQVDVAWLRDHIDEGVKLISLPLLVAVGGEPNPLAAIGALDRPQDCLVFADAAQAWGQMPLSLEASGCDVLIGTARKWLRGPRGISVAALSARARRLIEPRGVRPDHTRVLRLGLGAAIDYAQALGIDRLRRRILDLAARVQAGIGALAHLDLLDDGPPGCGMISFSAAGREQELGAWLADRGIASGQPAAVYHPGLFARHGLERVLRISPQYYNLESEIDSLLQALEDWRPGS